MNKYTKCFHIISLIGDAPPVGYLTVSQRSNNNNNLMPFPKKFVNLCNSHAFVNFVSLALITQDNQGGLIQQETSTSQEVQQNAGLIIASAASTPQRSRKGIPHIGGFEESLPSVNVLPKNFTRQTDRTEEKKGKITSHCENLQHDDFQIIGTI